ncbi:MAG: hypothetical protein SPK23_01495 [Eubacteriales bacterium]|nr:hypothetical protein [Eubacteriales bacterium]
MEGKEKADECIVGRDGELIDITWSDENPKKLLKRVNDLEKRLNELESMVVQKDKLE